MASRSKNDEESKPFIPISSPRDEDLPASTLYVQSYYERTRRTSMILSILAGAILSSLLWLIAWTSHSGVDSEAAHPSTVTTSCGWNYTSAITNNCKFQLWSYSWVPPECYDSKLNDDFLALQAEENWHYYSSLTPLTEVSLESVLVGDRNDLYSTWGQHYWHCAFYQRKFFRLLETSGEESASALRMTNRDLQEHHGIHCQEWLAKPDKYPWDKVNINLTVGYHFCS